MFPKKLLFSLLLIALIVSISYVNAVDSSNWKIVKVGDVNFKIPPQYQGGEMNSKNTEYHFKDLNTFGILCVDDYLANSYGYRYNFKAKNLTIGLHDAIYFSDYNSYVKHDVSHIYFSSGDSIYCICWSGSEVTDEIEEIIINTPDSSYDTNTFHSILNNAKNEYDNKKANEEYSYYVSTPAKSKDNYYFFWWH